MTTLSHTPEPATERVTHTLEATQLWRQVGWLGHSGRVYDLCGPIDEPGGFSPLWILLEDERAVSGEDDAA